VEGRALLLFKVLGYDRAIGRRCGDPITVAVAWRTGGETERDESLEALRETAARFSVDGRRVRVVPVRWEPGSGAGRIRAAGACVAVLPDALLHEAPSLAREAAALGLLTATDSRDGVLAGAALGFVRRGSRAAILVDVRSARAAGADLDAALFTVAEPVGGQPGR
jgi:hypothetical protein